MKALLSLIATALLANLGFQYWLHFMSRDIHSFVIVSPRDEIAMEQLDRLGEVGYSVVSARRAASEDEVASYEFVMQKRGKPDRLTAAALSGMIEAERALLAKMTPTLCLKVDAWDVGDFGGRSTVSVKVRNGCRRKFSTVIGRFLLWDTEDRPLGNSGDVSLGPIGANQTKEFEHVFQDKRVGGVRFESLTAAGDR